MKEVKRIIDYEEVNNEECKNMGMTIDDEILKKIAEIYNNSSKTSEALLSILYYGYTLRGDIKKKWAVIKLFFFLFTTTN